jgi:ATP-dependent exoDNAse (exonuclease V) beta subunit
MEREAREIRQIVDEWRGRPLPAGRTKPWSIAVLARARKHLTSITAELARDRGNGPVPFRAVEIDALNERSEVLDALALARALLHPADRVAWLAVLRAPWCGLSLADLLRLTGEGPSSDPEATVAELVAGRMAELSVCGQQLLARVWPILNEASTTLGRTSFTAQLERTWLSLGGDAALSAERLSNVRRFFEVLCVLEQEGAGYVDSAALNARLSRLFAETVPNDSAVQLLTIHNSKGLEFDVVLIPGLERPTPRSRSEILNWLELDSADGEAAHILLAPIHSRGEDSDGLNQWLSRVKHARESAETRRLLYVACTRAREVLYLFAACERDSKGILRKPAEGTLLRAGWPVAALQFATGAAAAETEALPPANPVIRGKLLPFAPTSDSEGGFALAAAADEFAAPETGVPLVRRLPLDFAPIERFTRADNPRLPYIPSANLPHEPTFERPEGSFAVRTFGNIVHRFLQLLASRIAGGHSPDELLVELPVWEPRLNAALRNEGLAPALAQREAPRAMTALRNTLTDPVGRWILAANDGAASERSIASLDATVLRADRSFVAGAAPLLHGGDRMWIIDFKTSEQGSRSAEQFEEQELLKYRAQLDRYAAVLRELSGSSGEIALGLYYPLIPRLLHWSS